MVRVRNNSPRMLILPAFVATFFSQVLGMDSRPPNDVPGRLAAVTCVTTRHLNFAEKLGLLMFSLVMLPHSSGPAVTLRLMKIFRSDWI